jgi:NAD(P)-dependent dehydrogenase (short-subunit alcohol dehydrogenase family)
MYDGCTKVSHIDVCGVKGNVVLSVRSIETAAGVMALADKPAKDGYDVQMQTNHLSHFLLTSILFPALEKAATSCGSARIVNHSSTSRLAPNTPLAAKYLEKMEEGSLGGHAGRWERYHQTKLANAVFTSALAVRFPHTLCTSSLCEYIWPISTSGPAVLILLSLPAAKRFVDILSSFSLPPPACVVKATRTLHL